MIERHVKARGRGVKVTFSIPTEWLDRPVSVVGDFNGWDPTATPLRKRGSKRTASVTLEANSVHQFRYLDALGRWHDDPDADDVVVNATGGTNCVLDLREPPRRDD